MNTLRTLEPLLISAPFGNYVKPAGATPTLGTFTAAARPGRLWRIIKTLRYQPGMKSWTNKIGLRNPGIDGLNLKVAEGKLSVAASLVSIHGFTDADWRVLLDKTLDLKPLGIELNLSCPNVGELSWPTWLFEDAAKRCADLGVRVVAKIPPVRYREMFDAAAAAGVRTFHCCNTLPVPSGGLSGKPLKAVSQGCLMDLKGRVSSAASEFTFIGGGGITTTQDIDEYAAIGAKHVAIGTKCFNPSLLVTDSSVKPLINHAHKVLGVHTQGTSG